MAMADGRLGRRPCGPARAIERAAWDDEPWLLLGALEQAVGERAAAEAAYGEAIERAPVHWRSAHARALLRLDHGDLDGAAADIELVQAQFPEFIGLIFARARLDLAQGRVAEAAEGFERYLGGLPADVDALFYAALAAEALGNVAQAQEYRERLGSRPGQGWRKLWLEARVLLDRNDAEAAEALLREPLAQGEAPALLTLLYADALTRQGRFDEALELLQRAHGARPESPGLRAALARLKMRSGDRDGAIALAESLSAEDPGNALAVEILADAALAEGGFDSAWLSRLQDAAGAAPQNAKLRLLLGRGYAALGNLEQGCAAVTDALLMGATADALSDLGRFKCAMRAPKRLRQAYERLSSTDAETAQRLLALFPDAVGGEDQGLGPAQAALAADPDDPTLRGALAANQLRAQQLDAAQATLDEAPEDQRGEPALIRGRAALAMARGDFLATERELQALSALDPTAAEPFFTLAAAALAADDPAAAGDWLSEGLGRDPTSPVGEAIAARLFAAEATDDGRRALIDLVKLAAPESPVVPSLDAQRLLAAGRNAEALAVLRRAAERHSDSAGLMLLLAMALDAEGQTEQAIAQSQAWLDTHPVASNLAHWLAQAQIKTGALDAAIATYRRLLMQAPVDALALNNLAVLVTEDDPTEAATLAGRALELAPESADFLDTYGAALLAKGEPDAARGYLERAYAGSGGNPAIGLNLARAELALGRADAAAKLLRDLVSQDFPDQAQAQALLRQAQTP
jgi:putative PEP-CTERM system TPR-repeat lipoprotein